MTKNNKQQQGMWYLIAPDNTTFEAESPLKCCVKERNSRLTNTDIITNIKKYVNLCDLCENNEYKYVLAKDTDIELCVCEKCKKLIFETEMEEK